MKLTTALASTAGALALLAGVPALANPQNAEPAAEVAAGAADVAAAAADADSGPRGPALWKVADEDTTLYLFGTVHALPKDLEWFDAEISGALAASDTLVTEIRMDPASEAKMQEVAMAKSRLPQGTTLRSLLNEEQTASYEAALTKLGVPAPAFDGVEPWLAGLTLTMLPLLQQGYSPDSGVEKILMGKAGEKPMDALETVEFQIGIFDGLPQEKQIAFLMESVEGMDDSKAMLDAMVEEWIEGDAEELGVLMNEGLSDDEIANALLYDRNANWVEWIVNRMEEPGTVFIAVGAGHLAGDKSVQSLLGKREIEVVRVK